MKRQVLSAAALAAALIVPQQSVTATKPGSNITDLGTLGGQFSLAFGINNINSDPASVQIVGRSTTSCRKCLARDLREHPPDRTGTSPAS